MAPHLRLACLISILTLAAAAPMPVPSSARWAGVPRGEGDRADGPASPWRAVGRAVSAASRTRWVNCVAFSSDGQTVASGTRDGMIRLWRVKDGEQLRELRAHDPWVHVLAMGDDGCLISGGADGCVRLWRPRGAHTPVVRKMPGSPVALCPSAGLVACSACRGDEVSVVLCRLAEGRPMQTLRSPANWAARLFAGVTGQPQWVSPVAFSADGWLVAFARTDQVIELWRMGSRRPVRRIGRPSHGDAASASGVQGESSLWSSLVRALANGAERLLQPFSDGGRWISALTFSPDGRVLAAGLWDGRVKLYRTSDGRLLRVLRGHTSRVCAIAFSADGALIATAGWDRSIKLWRRSGGRPVLTLPGHQWWVTCLAFSPDGSTLLSGGWDGAVRLWGVADGALRWEYDDAGSAG